MAHLHSIYDSDLHFVIDPVTRVITNQSANKNSVIQFDHNSERFTFELPRYIEEHDMLGCNRVEVHYVNIDSKTGTQVSGVYDVRDLQVSPHDDKVVICSWLVSNNATQYAGTLNFVVRFACTSGDVVDYVWNTAVFKNYAVQNGLYNSDPIVTQYPDVLAQWYDSLFTASADGVTNISEAKRAAITAVDAVADERIADIMQTGRDVVASLPADYVALAEDVAPPIVETETGAAIAVHDSANRKLRGLTLYGKSTQDGTPTPDAPVEIESVDNPVVTVCGKNLVNDALNGLNSAAYAVALSCGLDNLAPNTEYTISFVGVPGHKIYANEALFAYQYVLCDGKRQHLTVKTRPSVSKNNVGQYSSNRWIIFKNSEANTVQAGFVEVQIEVGSVATPYEPHKSVQTLPTTHTLHGIPVTSGGNYTDENGQQWVCDEVDFGRGVYVQRVHRMTLDGSSDESIVRQTISDSSKIRLLITNGSIATKNNTELGVALCDCAPRAFAGESGTYGGYQGISVDKAGNVHLFLDAICKMTESEVRVWLSANPVYIMYGLTTPVETALTAEELAAYASLRSNHHNTSVLNDGGAGMRVSYVADTKLYIDNKF